MTIIYIVLAVVILYGLAKVFMYIYRPYGMQKLVFQVDDRFNNLLSKCQKDIDFWVEQLEDKMSRISTDDEIKENLHNAQTAKDKQEGVYHKFLKLKERYRTDYLKLAEVINASNRYLDLKENQQRQASMAGKFLEHDIKSIDDIMSEAKKFQVILEEAEKKLDTLLTTPDL